MKAGYLNQKMCPAQDWQMNVNYIWNFPKWNYRLLVKINEFRTFPIPTGAKPISFLYEDKVKTSELAPLELLLSWNNV